MKQRLYLDTSFAMPKTPLLILIITITTYAQTSLLDERDGKTYKTVKIGTQIWMAENLNYDVEGSECYKNKPENCVKYGRLYNWDAALKNCPYGWHLPSKEEWDMLITVVGGEKTAGKKLKAKSGWKKYVPTGNDAEDCWNENTSKPGNGTDNYGFSALPGYNGTFVNFWSSTEINAHAVCLWCPNNADHIYCQENANKVDCQNDLKDAYGLEIDFCHDYTRWNRRHSKIIDPLSVRCVKD